MESLEKGQISCQGCSGLCCTFMKNSMQMSIVEGVDLYSFLLATRGWGEELESSLNECIREFRLNNRPSTGGTQLMRKTYTCPFFLQKELGCSIDPRYKPYGCLGFNPTTPQSKEGEGCESNTTLLKEREENPFQEEELNQKLKELLGLPWEKETIPQGLLDLHQAIKNLASPLHYKQ